MTHETKSQRSEPLIGDVVIGPTLAAEAALAELLNARVEFNEYALRNQPTLAVHLRVHDQAPVTVEQATRMMAFDGKREQTFNARTLLISGQLAVLAGWPHQFLEMSRADIIPAVFPSGLWAAVRTGRTRFEAFGWDDLGKAQAVSFNAAEPYAYPELEVLARTEERGVLADVGQSFALVLASAGVYRFGDKWVTAI